MLEHPFQTGPVLELTHGLHRQGTLLLLCVGEDTFETPEQNVLCSRRVWIAWSERDPSLLNSTVWEGNANPVLKLRIREEKSAL